MSTTASEMVRIEIVPARAGWPQDYADLNRKLAPILPPRTLLHHIGSSAVAGSAAKDVIDIQATVESLDDVDDQALAQAGFRRRPGLSDHCPAGFDLDEAALAKRFYKCDGRAANLHVRVAGHFNQRFALLCRDFLRSNDGAARAYATIKEQLATRFPRDADAYDDIKDPVCDLIMAGAEEWAQRTGWQEPPAD